MYDPGRFVEPLLGSFSRMHRKEFTRAVSTLPNMEDIESLNGMLMHLFFPGHLGTETPEKLKKVIQYSLDSTMHLLCDSIALCLGRL